VEFFLGVGWDWVHLVHWPLVGQLYQPWMIDDEFGAVSGMRIGRVNQSIQRKPAPVSLCPPQIPHVLTWTQTRLLLWKAGDWLPELWHGPWPVMNWLYLQSSLFKLFYLTSWLLTMPSAFHLPQRMEITCKILHLKLSLKVAGQFLF
jgi:hypothetical protein